MSNDGPPRGIYDYHVHTFTKEEKILGWFWFKGRKIKISPYTSSITIPIFRGYALDEDEPKKRKPDII